MLKLLHLGIPFSANLFQSISAFFFAVAAKIGWVLQKLFRFDSSTWVLLVELQWIGYFLMFEDTGLY